MGPGVAETQSQTETLSTASLLSAPGALALLADYARLNSSAQRKKVIELIKILADNDWGIQRLVSLVLGGGWHLWGC